MSATAITAKEVQAFVDACVLMKSTHSHFQMLFGLSREEDFKLLDGIAPIFFGDLSALLKEKLILQVCVITDPERTSGKENHTIKFFINNADFSNDPSKLAKLRDLSDAIHVFRDKVKPARDKIISHRDRQTILDRKSLGAASEKEWEQFWENLDQFIAILSEHLTDHRIVLSDVGMLTDTNSLIKQLRHGSYFDEMLHGNNSAARDKCIKVAFKE